MWEGYQNNLQEISLSLSLSVLLLPPFLIRRSALFLVIFKLKLISLRGRAVKKLPYFVSLIVFVL